MSKNTVTQLVEQWLQEFEKADSYELSRSEFVKEGACWYLRVYVDKLENGEYGIMSTDDCEIISRFLSDKLDEADPIKQNYVLEVSSPGMDRPLVNDKDFVRFAGQAVEVKLYEALDGSKMLEGLLKERKDGAVTIIAQNKEISVPCEKIAKINLAVVF